MRHDLSLGGYRYRLRPVETADAGFVVALRSNPELSAYINATSSDVADQVAWIERYFDRPGDWYFIVEDLASKQPEGTIGIYDYDPVERVAEWGRWVLRPGSLAAVESALLIYRAAFGPLGLKALYCRTVADNKRVVSFHDSVGVPRRALLERHVQIGGRTFDSVEHRLDAETWRSLEPNLDRLARRLAPAARGATV